MRIEDITEDNIEDYRDLIDEEFLSNTGREYCRGMVGISELTDEPDAVIFWELKDIESEKGKSSEILYFKTEDEDMGAKLLDEYDARTAEGGVSCSYFEFKDPGEIEQRVLEKNGFKLEKAESRDIYVTVGELAALKYAKKKPPKYIKSLSEVTVRQFKAGIMASVLHARYGLLEDLPYLPMSWYETDISSCVITDDKINGLLLTHELPSGILRIELLFAMEPDGAVNMLDMVRFSIHAAERIRNGDDRVLLRRHSPESEKLIDYLFPGAKGDEVVKGIKES